MRSVSRSGLAFGVISNQEGKYLTLAAVGFSKVTAADCFPSLSLVVERLLILPQKEKKSRTSFSEVLPEMPVTCTVVGLEDMFDMVVVGGECV